MLVCETLFQKFHSLSTWSHCSGLVASWRIRCQVPAHYHIMQAGAMDCHVDCCFVGVVELQMSLYDVAFLPEWLHNEPFLPSRGGLFADCPKNLDVG